MAARLTEALVKLHGVAGIRDGFQLLRMMIEQCWDRMYPVIETPDDLEVRAGPFNWIDHPTKSARFPWSVRMVPLIGRDKERFSWQQWKESLSGKGTVTSADIDRAITATTREALRADRRRLKPCVAGDRSPAETTERQDGQRGSRADLGP